MTASTRPEDRTVAFGIGAIAGSLLCPSVGIIFAILCRQESKRNRESQRWSHTALAFVIVGVVAYTVMFATGFPFVRR